MRLGFPREHVAAGFYSERNARVAVGSGRMAEIERASVVAQAGARSFAGPGPRCGLGVACARAKRWAEQAFAGFWAKIVTMSPRADFRIFLFPEN